MTIIRLSKREMLTKNKAYLDFLAGGDSGFGTEIKAKRVMKQRDPNAVTEAMVLRAIIKYLRHHPKVAFIRRQQSGVFQAGENRIVRVGQRGALDLSGMLKGGKRLEVEVKRPGGKCTPEQDAEIDMICAHGGIAFMAFSVEMCAWKMDIHA